MGVPALFRWLSAKYPKIVQSVVEQCCEKDGSGEEGAPQNEHDLTEPNPNGVEFDNLYLDMNGIIHPCCHPIDRPAPATEEAMMAEIFKYMDRIFAMIRPRRLLYLAIDGVAPRAKMNQQRSRRFRAAKERLEKQSKTAEDDDKQSICSVSTNNTGCSEPGALSACADQEQGNTLFDSNCITPGTAFMSLVAASVQYYVVQRMQSNAAWRQIKVIFSDASVPGEGEHKIVDYIRRQRLDPAHDPNTKHVIYGLDADLIMLSMATHEPHFSVLREDVFAEEKKRQLLCSHCGKKGHLVEMCAQAALQKGCVLAPSLQTRQPFIFLNVAVLREYLEAELRPPPTLQLPFTWELERAIDDWIFLCFFVGNDFLPHLPCLEIREGAIDMLMDIYKANFARIGGYLCHDGIVNLARIQPILSEVGALEQRIFQKRREKEERWAENAKRRKTDSNNSTSVRGEQRDANLAAARAFKAQAEAAGSTDTTANGKEEEEDCVRLWQAGSRERYYQQKFGITSTIAEEREKQIRPIVQAYVEGLCWVMAYYYQGCASWKWFYPYHFAPFASDLVGLSQIAVFFELGQPFRPFDQLMGVFPADSQALVPLPFRSLMTDVTSPIYDFYPTDFEIDMNGKRQAWHGVALLPFIEETRLLQALEPVYKTLSAEEKSRNERGHDLLFISLWHRATASIIASLDDERHAAALQPADLHGLAGSVYQLATFPAPGKVFSLSRRDDGSDTTESIGISVGEDVLEGGDVRALPFCEPISDLQVSCFRYAPPFAGRKALVHRCSRLLPEAQPPARVLALEDVHLVQSGQASRRLPGRLLFDHFSSNNSQSQNGHSYGRHSMHQEYSRSFDRFENDRAPQARSDHYSSHEQSHGHRSTQYAMSSLQAPHENGSALQTLRHVMPSASASVYPPPPNTYPPPANSTRHQPVLGQLHRRPPSSAGYALDGHDRHRSQHRH